jgi:hypothetical protein
MPEIEPAWRPYTDGRVAEPHLAWLDAEWSASAIS